MRADLHYQNLSIIDFSYILKISFEIKSFCDLIKIPHKLNLISSPIDNIFMGRPCWISNVNIWLRIEFFQYLKTLSDCTSPWNRLHACNSLFNQSRMISSKSQIKSILFERSGSIRSYVFFFLFFLIQYIFCFFDTI